MVGHDRHGFETSEVFFNMVVFALVHKLAESILLEIKAFLCFLFELSEADQEDLVPEQGTVELLKSVLSIFLILVVDNSEAVGVFDRHPALSNVLEDSHDGSVGDTRGNSLNQKALTIIVMKFLFRFSFNDLNWHFVFIVGF